VPEGHTIHRLARDLRRDLDGQRVEVTSPQGRFAASAARLDGQVPERIEAWGKHLFVAWETGEVLHVHLGLIGKFRPQPDTAEPRPSVRLRLAVPGRAWWLVGPTVCELGTPELLERTVAKLGPDPLRPDGDEAEFVARLRRKRIPVGAALLDQGVVAGIGNVYRAELLFLEGIDPRRPANGLAPEEAAAIWRRTVDLLRVGVRIGRIVTRDPAEVGAPAGRIPKHERLYVYHRSGQPCRRCGDAVAEAAVAGRRCWWCPTCQPA
jgi:endonuclease-8